MLRQTGGAIVEPALPSVAATGSAGTSIQLGPTVSNPYGSVPVQVAMCAGKVVDVQAVRLPEGDGTSQEINRSAEPQLKQQALTAQSVRSVLRRCEELRHDTRAFDVEVSGSLDPSGYVKGWAAERARRILERHGLTDFQINARGDIVVRGGARPGEGWLIGLRHPDRHGASAGVALLRGGAIATSGDDERGSHVSDPRTGARASGLRSVTVTAPELGTADAWATAILAYGEAGLKLLADAPEGLEAFVIRDGANVVHTGGFPSISKIPIAPGARA